jgi:hypothetical protein
MDDYGWGGDHYRTFRRLRGAAAPSAYCSGSAHFWLPAEAALPVKRRKAFRAWPRTAARARPSAPSGIRPGSLPETFPETSRRPVPPRVPSRVSAGGDSGLMIASFGFCRQ